MGEMHSEEKRRERVRVRDRVRIIIFYIPPFFIKDFNIFFSRLREYTTIFPFQKHSHTDTYIQVHLIIKKYIPITLTFPILVQISSLGREELKKKKVS